jgi:hypothetical protein
MRTGLRHRIPTPSHARRSRKRASEPPHMGEPKGSRRLDPAVQRVRHAGGPLDRACYSCGCGYVFTAPVSTTVACPHCRAPQAW